MNSSFYLVIIYLLIIIYYNDFNLLGHHRLSQRDQFLLHQPPSPYSQRSTSHKYPAKAKASQTDNPPLRNQCPIKSPTYPSLTAQYTS
mmetsp:Transcript_20474/g.30734  ORF Transcript_20474/g.30734 Transcript_20474/m.30734 type:complete len:88 (+) Transcript_20474:59-322(+)